MKKFIVILLALYGVSVFAQKSDSKNAILKLGKKEDVIDVITLGNQGFLIKTGIAYAGRKKDIKIHRFNSDLSRKYSVDLPKASNDFLTNYLVASKYTGYIYSIQQSKVFNAQNGNFIVARIDSNGKTSNFTIPVSDDLEKADILAAFENDEKMVLLSSVKKSTTSKEKINGKKQKVTVNENKLEMYIMGHNEKKFHKKTTEVNLIGENSDEDLTVEFLGNDEVNFFLARKSVNLLNGTTQYAIYTMGMEGEIIETTEIKSDNKYVPLASKNLRETFGSEIQPDDYDVIVRQSGKTTITTYVAKAGSFGCSQLDLENGYFYIYGLATDKLKKDKKGNVDRIMEIIPNSFFIQKFDLETGDLISEYLGKLPKSLTDDKEFSRSNFMRRCIAFHVVDSGMVRFNIFGNKMMHTLAINFENDKLTNVSKEIRPMKGGTFSHDRSVAALFATAADGNSNMVSFVKKFPSFREKEYSVFGIAFGQFTAVVQNTAFTKDPKLQFHLFDNSQRKR